MAIIGASNAIQGGVLAKLGVNGFADHPITKMISNMDSSLQQQLEKPLSVVLGGSNALAIGSGASRN
jgi:hypothetical protein